MVNGAVVKDYQTAAPYTAVDQYVQQFISEALIAIAVATSVTNSPTFTVSVVLFSKHEIEKNSFKTSRMEKLFDKFAVQLLERESKKKTGFRKI